MPLLCLFWRARRGIKVKRQYILTSQKLPGARHWFSLCCYTSILDWIRQWFIDVKKLILKFHLIWGCRCEQTGGQLGGGKAAIVCDLLSVMSGERSLLRWVDGKRALSYDSVIAGNSTCPLSWRKWSVQAFSNRVISDKDAGDGNLSAYLCQKWQSRINNT